MKAIGFAVAAAILVGLAAPASAAQVTVTYTGTISGSVNNANLFGGGSLDGLNYTAVYHYDSTVGQTNYAFVGGSSSASINGGNETGSLTVNGITENVPGAVSVGLTRSSTFLGTSSATDEVQSATSDRIQSYAYLNNLTILPSIDTAFSADFSSVINNIGIFSFNSSATFGYLNSDSLVVSVSGPVVSPVPLPPSFPLFGAALFGLAAAGYALKRRPGDRPA